MKIAGIVLLIIVVSLLIGAFFPRIGTKPGKTTSVATGRFKAEYQGAFDCGKFDREYRRAIYVITDTETGEKYLAVQGCGTSQLVSERQGKHTVQVER